MNDVPDAILIARCPIHGLHGERERCYVCDLPCEQVRLVSAERLRAAEGERDRMRDALEELIVYARGNPVVMCKIHAALGIGGEL